MDKLYIMENGFSGLEVYSEFCGFCLATGNAIRKGKLEIGQDRIAMAKVSAAPLIHNRACG